MNTNRLSVKTLFKTGLLLVVFLATTGCGPGQFLGPTMTPIPTDTPTPTATSSPTPTFTPTIAPTVTPRPTKVPDKIIFSDTFDDNSNHWDPANFIKIEDGLMQISSGKFDLAAIKIPLDVTPNDVSVQVDIIPNPPAGADPSAFLYGVGCRVNKTGSDFYFFGVSPAPGVDDLFIATFLQFKESTLVDYQFFPAHLPDSQSGDGFTATFRCLDTRFTILAGNRAVADVTNRDFRKGDLFLGLYQPDGISGSVSFDNLTVSQIH
ncbi:MAG TPA: hypothetical protein VK897_09800 [Anaerolineales bacterium]|nr:hypothetical protein [Anaerolineales bacterium]